MAEQDKPPPVDDGLDRNEQSFVSHLVELRTRIIRALICVFLVLLALTPLTNYLYEWLADPLLAHTEMVAVGVAAPFLAPFKLAIFVAVFISAPYIFYQFWAFVAPGLYMHEQRFALPLLISSTLLFYGGIAFAYFVVFPLMFAFFTAVAPEGVTVMTDISLYLDFVLKMFFAFGIAFEVPVATYLSVRTGITTVEDLRRHRPYIIIGAFIVGMLLTPPDIISQVLLALPVWLLYEIGLFLCSFSQAGEEDAANADEGASESTDPKLTGPE